MMIPPVLAAKEESRRGLPSCSTPGTIRRGRSQPFTLLGVPRQWPLRQPGRRVVPPFTIAAGRPGATLVPGLPTQAARDFLRRVRITDFDEEWALSLLKTLGAADPKSTLDSFEHDRYIEPAEHSPNGYQWRTTATRGNALAVASSGNLLRNRSAAISITTEDVEQLTDNIETVYSIHEDPGVVPPPSPQHLLR
jgi:hypothetical protein